MSVSISVWSEGVAVHSLAVTASLLTYVLTTRSQHTRRPPAIAIAWVLGLFTLPYLALPLYLLFGRRKLPRQTRLAALPAPRPRGHGRHWAEDLIESFGLPAASGAAVRLHRDGGEARAALWDTISRASRQLDVGTYLLGDDELGREVAARLMARARDGVRVRFLVDGVGALQMRRSVLRDLHAAGVETAVFCPLLARKTGGPRNLRNHRKCAIADAAVLWAGGRNLAAEYFIGARGAPPWLDLSFDLEGAVAAAAAAQFEADWIVSGGKSATRAAARTFPAAANLAQFLPSGPDQAEDTVHALLIDAFFRAERRVLAVSPYFVPDAGLEAAIRLAARRGVAIDLCLPAKSNHRLADFARSRSLRALVRAGVAVHLLPGMVHAKAVVFDASLALCGSVNLDSRSLLLNYELAVVLYGQPEIDWLEAWIRALIADAHPFAGRAPGLWRDLAEGLLLTVAYQL